MREEATREDQEGKAKALKSIFSRIRRKLQNFIMQVLWFLKQPKF